MIFKNLTERSLKRFVNGRNIIILNNAIKDLTKDKFLYYVKACSGHYPVYRRDQKRRLDEPTA